MEIKQVALSQMKAELSGPAWSDVPVIFIGDVGGTNARLGFARRAENDGLALVVTRFHMVNKDVKDLLTFFRAILATVPASIVSRVEVGVLSVPGLVKGGTECGPFINLKGVARIADFPVELFPRENSRFLNDLEAGAFGILASNDAHALGDYFSLMWEGTQWSDIKGGPAGSSLGHGHCVVLAPGTGLGASLIHYNDLSKRYTVMPLGLSSTTVTLRGDHEYVQATAAKLGHQPSFEDMACGSALERHYAFIAGGRQLPAGEIAQMASAGDANAVKAMRKFNEYLMRLGSEASVAFLSSAVILIGDNIVHNKSFYENPENVEWMKGESRNHLIERFGFLGRITYLRQKKLLNLNLVGCFYCAISLLKKGSKASKL